VGGAARLAGQTSFPTYFCYGAADGEALPDPLDTTLQRPIEDLTDPIKIGEDAGLKLRIYIA
jgi:hypothetical protein